MMWLRKSKKGFTLIELMVVVAIIGVLVLLGLRAYSSQKQRAMNSIAKANASTIQTMLVGYMGDHDINGYSDIEAALGGAPDFPLESMVNPYSATSNVWLYDTAGSLGPGGPFTDFNDAAEQGKVSILLDAPNIVLLNALDQLGNALFDWGHALPANKY